MQRMAAVVDEQNAAMTISRNGTKFEDSVTFKLHVISSSRVWSSPVDIPNRFCMRVVARLKRNTQAPRRRIIVWQISAESLLW